MRDPLGLNERLFACWYPLVCGLAERVGQREMRARLIADARGRTLEIGAGSGLNIAHYPDQVSELIISEPSPHMLEQLRAQLAADPPRAGSWELVQAGAEELPFEDGSFDTVVGTYVLCSVDDPDRVLREIERVLRPGGHYLYLEHVHAGEGTMLGHFQDLVEVPHRYIAAGCHPNRRTERLLEPRRWPSSASRTDGCPARSRPSAGSSSARPGLPPPPLDCTGSRPLALLGNC